MARRLSAARRQTPTGARGRYGDSRRGLAEAAIRHFEEHGFAETTVGELSRAAGYSERTFFRQFPSKEDVVFFDLPDILEPVRQLVGAQLTLDEAFAAVGVAMVQGARGWESNAPELAERRTRMIHTEPALYRRFVEISTEWEVVIAGVFATARGTEVAQDVLALSLAGAIVTGCRAAMTAWLATPDSSLGALMELSLEHIASGYGLATAPARG